MARIRYLKPGFFLNEVLGKLPPLVRLLFAGLWTIADREGRLEDRPERIKLQTVPYDDCDVDEMLDRLQDNGFILRYQAAGKRYIQILNFWKHQKTHCKEPASVIPPPDADPAPPRHPPGTVRDTHPAPCQSPTLPHGERVTGNGEQATGNGELRTENGALAVARTPERERARNSPDGLHEFLDLYPKKVKRDPAARAYVSVVNTPEEHHRLIEGLRWHLQCDQWVRSLREDGGRYIPDPDRFIFERLYRDRPSAYQEKPDHQKGLDVIDQAVRNLAEEFSRKEAK